MSTIRTNTLSNVAGTQSTAIENAINGSAKAWVNFNGTGTVAIRASFNVTSITDNGTGTYVVNFSTAMPDANYSWGCSATATSGSNMIMGNNSPIAPTSSALAIMAVNAGVALIDPPYVSVQVFR